MKKIAVLIAILLALFVIILIGVRIEEREESLEERVVEEVEIKEKPQFLLEIIYVDRENGTRTEILTTADILSMDSKEIKIKNSTYVGIDISTLCENCSITILHDKERIKVNEGLIAYSRDGEFLEELVLILPSGEKIEGIERIEIEPLPRRRIFDVLTPIIERIFSPPTEITTSVEIAYTYEDILSLELHVSDVSQSPIEYLWDQSTIVRYSESPTRTASYNSIDVHTWEKSFDGESSGSIRVEYAVVSRRSSFSEEGDKEARIEESPSWAKERYLKNESIADSSNREIKLIEINEEMKSLAESIVGNEDRIYYASESIYDWIVDNIRYRIDNDPYPKGAARTLEEREGDCDDMSALFCSLARSIGIPCYMVDGYVINRAGDLPYAHTWVGVIVPGEERIFDALAVDPAFKEFGYKGANKMVVGFDPGSSEYMQKAYRAFKFTYENSDGTNGSAAIVSVAKGYADDRDPLYDIKKRSMI